MNDDVLKKIARSGGCRLCLAPDSECVPIFATAAADKEPLSNKILSCIGIKVSQSLKLFSFRNDVRWVKGILYAFVLVQVIYQLAFVVFNKAVRKVVM